MRINLYWSFDIFLPFYFLGKKILQNLNIFLPFYFLGKKILPNLSFSFEWVYLIRKKKSFNQYLLQSQNISFLLLLPYLLIDWLIDWLTESDSA